MKGQLAGVLPSTNRARHETDLYIHEPSAEQRRLVARADDAVVAGHGTAKGVGSFEPGSTTATTAVAAPAARLIWPDVLPEELHHYVEIRTSDDREVVTVIELISPTNKASDRSGFINKRHNLHASGVHFIQIDLLRAGRSLLPEEAPRSDYNAMLLRGRTRTADVWAWSLRDPLPILPVPLAGDDPDVTLDLHAALDATYDANRYERYIYPADGVAALDPPLSDADAAWAAALLAAAA